MKNFFKPSVNKICDNCKHFWLAAERDGSPANWGWCHKLVPQVIPDIHGARGDTISTFPTVAITSGCDQGSFTNPEFCSKRAAKDWERTVQAMLEAEGVQKAELDKVLSDLADAAIKLPIRAAIQVAQHRLKGEDVFYGGTPPGKFKELSPEEFSKQSAALADRINDKLGMKKPAPAVVSGDKNA